MSKGNEDFFSHKSEWAKVKDELLSCYLKPYAAKILTTGRPLLYIDCFAGKGRFDDGEDGSPLIAEGILSEAIQASSVRNPAIKALYVDKEYAGDLAGNLANVVDNIIIKGEYRQVPAFLEDHAEPRSNVFLYIDPYGIASLDMSFFDSLAERYPSVEILMNLNTFGFFREACRVFGIEYADVESTDDLPERETWSYHMPAESERRLDVIAGGDYWREIVADYKSGLIDGYEAEKRFAAEYCDRLGRSYAYTQHFPIRVKQGNRPKYRMIHATCHPEGATLMYKNMISRKELLLSTIQRGGQLSMFDEDVENEVIDMNELERAFRLYALEHANGIGDHELLAGFVAERGVTCSLAEFRGILRNMEESGELVIDRVPAYTERGVSRFMESKGKRRLTIRRA